MAASDTEDDRGNGAPPGWKLSTKHTHVFGVLRISEPVPERSSSWTNYVAGTKAFLSFEAAEREAARLQSQAPGDERYFVVVLRLPRSELPAEA